MVKNSLRALFVFVFMSTISACNKEPQIEFLKPQSIIRFGDTRLKAKVLQFSKDTVYLLQTDIVRDSSQILKIEAGTLIKVAEEKGITVNRGARIEAVGTPDRPVIFTVANFTGIGGISVGRSENTWAGIKISGLNNFSSADLRYARIEFAGKFSSAALALEKLDQTSVINNIQISYSSYQSLSIDSGNVNLSNIITYATYFEDIRILNGYKGKMQNILVYRHPYFFSSNVGRGLAGIWVQGEGTFPAISNLSVLGAGVLPGSNTIEAAIVLSDGAKLKLSNSILANFAKQALYVDHALSAQSLANEESRITNTIFHSVNESAAFTLPRGIFPPFNSSHLKAFLLQAPFNNRQFRYPKEFLLKDPLGYDTQPNPFPAANSPVLTGASFDDPAFADPFFNKVPYRGALGTDNWMEGWVNFLPLQTKYNYK